MEPVARVVLLKGAWNHRNIMGPVSGNGTDSIHTHMHTHTHTHTQSSGDDDK